MNVVGFDVDRDKFINNQRVKLGRGLGVQTSRIIAFRRVAVDLAHRS